MVVDVTAQLDGTERLTRLEGAERTQTMVAFQQFSAHDLEAMFGLGMEEKTG